jgi:GAF domain
VAAMKLLRNIFRRKNRELPSVADFESSETLTQALGGAGKKPKKLQDSISTLVTEQNGEDWENHSPEFLIIEDVKVVDWKLPTFDAETTNIQTMEKELERLLILRSFHLLDTGREEHFDRLVKLAAEIFQAPMALISLVDLGRQWFLSSKGLGDITETPREISICAHVVQGKTNQPLVIPDLTKDFRFKENPVVTGPMALRFYAGAPLISPEGLKIGSFCVIDTVTRPEGFTVFDEEILMDLANMAMKLMVQRRSKLLSLQRNESNFAETADLLESFDRIICPVTDIQKLYQNLNEFVEPLPKNVPITLELDATLPRNVECDDLLLFRSSLILLNNAVTRTKTGNIHFIIKANDADQTIVFECEDSGNPSLKKKLVPDSKSQLLVMQAMVEKMNGKHGISTRGNENSFVWFSVPMITLSMYENGSEPAAHAPSLLKVHSAKNSTVSNLHTMKKSSNTLKGTIVSDPFQNEIVTDVGCKPIACYTPNKNALKEQHDVPELTEELKVNK